MNAALKWRLQRSKKKRTWEIYCAAVNIRAIARHWLKLDPCTCAQFDEIVESLYPNSKKNKLRSTAMSQKVMDLFLALQDDNLLRSLLELARPSSIATAGSMRSPARNGSKCSMRLVSIS